VLESILGLIYINCGYDEACAVADELEITLARDKESSTRIEQDTLPNEELLVAAAAFTGYTNFVRHDLVEEAFTHPTAIHPVVQSYQRLEWVGDAVLCLAVREWIYRTFPSSELGQMVAMEASLVSNETLAFLSIKHGLPKHLNHCDQTLPSRLERYEFCTQELGRGLWGTGKAKRDGWV